jgi:DNA-binding LacI/PurR family transcriptional regulator
MTEIANRLGVSVSTVSYALSGRRTVSEGTRRRVLAEMERANFQPNAAGRALASRRSRTIALLYPAGDHGLTTMPLEFVIGAAEVASKLGYALVVSTSPAEDEQILSLIQRGAVDGLVLMEVALRDPRVEMLRARQYPFTMIGHCSDNAGISFVDLDFPQAIDQAVSELHRLGHRRLVLIDRDTETESGYGPSVRSRQGFYLSTLARGIHGFHFSSGPTAQDGYRVTSSLLIANPEVTGIVITNSDVLGGVFNALHDSHMAIPDDISIVAIASRRIAELMVPPLTTVDFPAAEMGRIGVESLIAQLEGETGPPNQRCLQTGITVRQSTGPVKSAAEHGRKDDTAMVQSS